MVKSPFIVIEEFISPKLCEDIVDKLWVEQPDVDKDGDPIKMERFNEALQSSLYHKISQLVPTIEETYDVKYRGSDKLVFQYYPEFSKRAAEAPGCENSKYVRKKWVKVKDVDLTAVIWLKSYNNQIPLDPSTEVYGGKLEFPAYNFSLLPQRGMLVLYPAGPHFITAISPVLVGDLYQIKLNIAVQPKQGGIWLYDPSQFPGTWNQWFENFF